MEFYSQYGQDQFLYENFFKDKTYGYYVDIGAHDGITGSNTYFFEKMGWDGICFEPIPSVFEKLSKNRKCKSKKLAISNKFGTEQFFCIDGHSEMLSGLVSSYDESHIIRINRELEAHTQSYEYIDVECSTFEKEIDNRNIDILSIDTEGSEEAIINSIDFDKYEISFLVFEMNYYNNRLIDFVNSKNFQLVANFGPDLIYKKI